MQTNFTELQKLIEKAWECKETFQTIPNYVMAVEQTLEDLNDGNIRVAEPTVNGWQVNEWAKQAILLYFQMQKMGTSTAGIIESHDKIPLKANFAQRGIRVVPGAIARYGAFIEKGVILMPSFVNIGAYVGSGTMVDTWATVGSCAQIGKNVHLSGGVGIGGVLEPVQASPVIIEDGAFLGSRCIIVEGVRVGKEAVLGAGVIITKSTPIINTETGETTKGFIPPRAVVIPGSYKKFFKGGEFNVPCALIVGQRKESTDLKISLNDALREHNVAV